MPPCVPTRQSSRLKRLPLRKPLAGRVPTRAAELFGPLVLKLRLRVPSARRDWVISQPDPAKFCPRAVRNRVDPGLSPAVELERAPADEYPEEALA
jgi:hypothetical protein